MRALPEAERALQLAAAKFDTLAKGCQHCHGVGTVVKEVWLLHGVIEGTRGPRISALAGDVCIVRRDCLRCNEFRQLSHLCLGRNL